VEKLTVGLAENKYDILIGDGLLDDAGEFIRPFCPTDGSIVTVTDENVWEACRERFSSSLSRAGLTYRAIVLPAGERHKSLPDLLGLFDSFARMSLMRDGLVVALGGGVTGDLCGFAAATWMRGVKFAQIPTTLLAQVDSSVGGKTAVNLPQGKNLVGTFYQPKLVVIDPSTLRTLPAREIRSGMAEVIKYGAIRSRELFKTLETGPSGDFSRIIHECCRIKSEIVARDERDLGERMLLNFGHTMGHAIEKQSGFERYRHGEAVALGMTLAAGIGETMGLTAPGVANSLRRVLTLHGLDTDYPGNPLELLPSLTTDKKSGDGGVRLILLSEIGAAFARQTSFTEIRGALEDLARA
jgi:3-dehydroquinate synthase